MGESAQMGWAVKNSLRRICCENGWSYGVFWRFDHRNSMLLTLEDAYFEEQMRTMLGNMLLQVHMLGEGIIGQSAFTGKHHWMFSDASSGEWDSSDSCRNRDLLQGDSEIHRQFSSGIKTIAVISMEPLGVVLFGSTEKILENTQFLDQTKTLFREMDKIDTLHQSEYLPSSLNNGTSDFGSIFDSLISFGNSFNGNLRSSNGDISDAVKAEMLSSNEHNTQFQHVFQSSSPFVNSATETTRISPWSSEGSVLSLHEEINPDGFMTDPSKCYTLDNLYELFAPLPSQSTGTSLLPPGLFETDGFVDIPVTRQANSMQSSISYATNYGSNDVFDCSGMDFGYTLGDDCWEDIAAPVVSSACTAGPRKGLFSELGIEELLNGIGNSSSVVKSSLVDQFCSNKRRKSEGSSTDSNHVQLSNISCPSTSASYTQPAYKKIISTSEPKKLEEPAKGARKRARPGESTRPRPKDRQMIQDRLTELRKIIPNGHKPSIDVLLDRTIKYMLFLQSVTKYADKLKQADEPKMIDKGNGVVLKDSSREGGVTWAFDVGGQMLVCPIIVEDLSPPGQMLIEMLCEDQGFFLEIADILRGFGLNILKGVMELRENKIWARFIVEANKQVTRIDIFWSLIQLLQQTATGNVDDHGIHELKNSQQPLQSFPVSLGETLE